MHGGIPRGAAAARLDPGGHVPWSQNGKELKLRAALLHLWANRLISIPHRRERVRVTVRACVRGRARWGGGCSFGVTSCRPIGTPHPQMLLHLVAQLSNQR